MFTEEFKNQVCNKESCRASYQARWIHNDGKWTDASEGLCPQCQIDRAVKHRLLLRQLRPAKEGELRSLWEDWPAKLKAEKCVDCGEDYEAVLRKVGGDGGKWLDCSSQRCGACRIVWRKSQQARLAKEREDAQRQEYQAAIPLRREGFRQRQSSIPQNYQGKRFDSLNLAVAGNMRMVHGACMKYADGFPVDYAAYLKQGSSAYNSLFIGSETWGNGKTTLLCAILHRILDRWEGIPRVCPVYFITEPEIYSQIQATYNYTDEEKAVKPSEEDIIRRLISVPLLAIDDIGKQERSDMRFVQRTMFAIINGRYNAKLPVIISANKGGEQLAMYLGGNNVDLATFDRLSEMCKGNFWVLKGESWRAKK